MQKHFTNRVAFWFDAVKVIGFILPPMNFNVVCQLLLLVSLYGASLPCFAQEPWQLRKSGEGINVFSRKAAGQKLQELRVETSVTGTVAQVIAAVTDVDKHDEWVYKALNTRLLKTLAPQDFYYYTEIDAPWPFDNRDLVLRMTVSHDNASGKAIIKTLHAENIVPAVKDVVRITYSRGHWTLTPSANNQVKIEYEILVDTGIGLPAWLINMFIANAPYETFLHLRDWMKQAKYAQLK